MPSFNQTPDKPESFGTKVSWFAVRATDPAAVLDALELEEATPANWASGLAAAYTYKDPWVFVSPPVSGWILAVSLSWPYPVSIESSSTSYQHDIGRRFDALFARLMQRFDDVQFFGSLRLVGFVAWARALKGKPIRMFAIADELLANAGDQTREEAKLGFVDLSGLSPPDAHDRIFEIAEEQNAEEDKLVASGLSRREAWAKVRQNGRDAMPDERDVLELAALWSIDPMELSEQDHPLGLGLAARLPEDLAQ